MLDKADVRTFRRKIRLQSWHLKTIVVRQAARKAFDLSKLGTGPLERIATSLILAVAFGFAGLAAAHLVPMDTTSRLGIGGIAFATVLGTSAVLVLWGSRDDVLAERAVSARTELDWLRDSKAQLEGAIAEQEDREREWKELQEEERRRNEPRTKRCPYCREVILQHAAKCRFCHEILDGGLALERQPRSWNPGVAAVFSFLVPGLGQMYKGEVLAGLVWLFSVYGIYAASGAFCCVGGFVLFPMGLILHVVCLFDAASGS
jgi:TM2 domain-containing membrane protein YozV